MDESEAWFIDVANWNFLWDRLSQKLMMLIVIIIIIIVISMITNAIESLSPEPGARSSAFPISHRIPSRRQQVVKIIRPLAHLLQVFDYV
ncbi:hypothetical protein ACLKA6_008153 [Drosophila palustris]